MIVYSDILYQQNKSPQSISLQPPLRCQDPLTAVKYYVVEIKAWVCADGGLLHTALSLKLSPGLFFCVEPRNQSSVIFRKAVRHPNAKCALIKQSCACTKFVAAAT